MDDIIKLSVRLFGIGACVYGAYTAGKGDYAKAAFCVSYGHWLSGYCAK